MKKALVVFSLVALLAIPVLGLTGCGDDLSDADIAKIQGLFTRMDNAEGDISERYTKDEVDELVGDIEAPDLSDYVTLETYNTLKDDHDKLAERVKELENSQGTSDGGSNSIGQVSVKIEEGTLYVLSNLTGSTYRFTVKITNNTDDWQYVSYELLLQSNDPPADVDTNNDGSITDDVGLTYWGNWTVNYTPTTILGSINAADQLMFVPDAKIPINKNSTVEITYQLAIKTDGNEKWEGNLTGVVISETW
jgi:hypothetical protein